ncbi:aldehyde ferredoxin oxidoreductase family protein [bacterium]|nr:aldehyde ferredoxin oxidoreductase family protein [bacterium]
MSYKGKILRVDLTTRQITTEPLPMDLAKQYIGGRGLATKLFCDEVDPAVDALSPENKLLMATGSLTGTAAPTGGRYMVITKSPLTGTIASSNSGGFFGAKLKDAGYDIIIFEGKASGPVYLKITEETEELVDATSIWGKDVYETTSFLLDETGDINAKVACIGPAGENLSFIAAIMNDNARAAGRSGVGAVMGSKNLKAVIVSARRNKPTVFDDDAFKAVIKVCQRKIKEDAVTGEGLPTYGTKVLDNIINTSGMYPTNNFQLCMFKDISEISGEALVEKGYFKKRKACFACPIACGRDVELPNGKKGEGPEYESGWSLGALCGVNDLISITEANFMCNELGLDTISAGVTIAAAMELYEKGYLPKEDLENGPELKFGSSEAVVYYIRAMGTDQGILGRKMAQGAWRMADSYGHPELAMCVKKQGLPAYDPRGVQGQGLAYATQNRGGCHVRGYLIAPEILAHPEAIDPQELESKPAWVKGFQDLTAVIDSCGLCLFSSFAIGADEYNDLINAATGSKNTVDDLMKIGERIWNLEKLFNLKSGLTVKDDTLPRRLLEEPLTEGPNKGQVHHLDKLLPQYYVVRGWDEGGVPTKAKLLELGLD